MNHIVVRLLAAGIAGAAFAQPAHSETCTAGPFMVFFDTQDAKVTPQGQAILDNAAASYDSCGDAKVTITGHADRSSNDKYNMAISKRRAESVRRYLAAHGVPNGKMTTQAFGESRPLVETADGVKEPQNRRVDITYGP
jgi:outer membrane protein OmpA-like peptidoglycan-associated protein